MLARKLKLLSVFLILCFSSGYSQIKFSLKPNSSKKYSFFISEIQDNNNRLLGSLFRQSNLKNAVSFQSSVENEFNKYHFLMNKNGLPLKLEIIALSISENAFGNQIKGEIIFEFNAFNASSNETNELCHSRNVGHYTRGFGEENFTFIEKQLNNTIESGLNFIEQYIKKNQGQIETFATRSKVIIKPFKLKNQNDTVYYQQRKVNWSDFKGQNRSNSHYAAAIFTSFGFESKRYVHNNTLTVEIIPNVFMSQKGSWARTDAKNPYNLKHEQLHFDICYLLCCQFLLKIKDFHAENNDDLISKIQYEYLETYRRITAMQDLYDDETDHSLIVEKQNQWQNEITEQINKLPLNLIFD